MNTKLLFHTIPPRGFIFIAVVLCCFALSQTAQAVKPPDGGYAGQNTAEGTDALFSLTTGLNNTAVGLPTPRGYPFSNTAQGTKKAIEAAAAAKAAAGREARTEAPFDSLSPKTVGTFITFDAPGAVNGTTYPSSISPAGAITGYFSDANFELRGFLRSPNGTFITFDALGAVYGTVPSSISSAGAITGYFYDANFEAHGFMRKPNGTFTTFDAPGAAIIGTLPYSINPAGVITGTFFDVNFTSHGFLRATDGTITTIDVPGASTDFFSGTLAVAINPLGVITGIYYDANFASHGFVRASDGTLTTFDPPGFINVFAPFSFGPDLSITPDGVITGTYFELIAGNPFGGNYRVFVRARDGTFTTFDAATYPPCCIWSFPSGMNPAGTITGSFNDGFSINHGFLRASDGTITTLDVPGSSGTAPLGITPKGVIMGLYFDASGAHGFLRSP